MAKEKAEKTKSPISTALTVLKGEIRQNVKGEVKTVLLDNVKHIEELLKEASASLKP